MVFCKKCMYCTKMELETIEIEDGIMGSYWMCYCGLDQNWEDDRDEPCSGYIEDKTRHD